MGFQRGEADFEISSQIKGIESRMSGRMFRDLLLNLFENLGTPTPESLRTELSICCLKAVKQVNTGRGQTLPSRVARFPRNFRELRLAGIEPAQ